MGRLSREPETMAEAPSPCRASVLHNKQHTTTHPIRFAWNKPKIDHQNPTWIEGWDNYTSESNYYLNHIGAGGINKCPPRKNKSAALNLNPHCSEASSSFRQWRVPSQTRQRTSVIEMHYKFQSNRRSVHDDHCRLEKILNNLFVKNITLTVASGIWIQCIRP